jgi:hypothetical protein
MTNSQKLEAATEKLHGCGDHYVAIWTNVRAIRERLETLRQPILVRAATSCVPFHSGQSLVVLAPGAIDTEEITKLSIILEIAENSSLYAEAREVIDPLLAAVETLKIKVAEDEAERSRRHAVLVEAEAQAVADATAAVETNPTVVAARKALAAV